MTMPFRGTPPALPDQLVVMLQSRPTNAEKIAFLSRICHSEN